LEITLDADRVLRNVRAGDLDAIFALASANREHLAPWMPWANPPQREETEAWLRDSLAQEEREDGFQAAIVDRGRIVGVIGFHGVDRRALSTTIGYWLAEDAQGRGTMTMAVEALVDLAFGDWGLHRVEIRAAPANARSRAVAERLGFTQEGVLREAERFGDRYVDLVVYSVLAPEWATR
jgi:ribosomal-protein-serine acetyltransferase